jgi:Flp pilus assembly protein CpaB
VIRFPEEFVPISAFQSVEEVVGSIARTEIYREELVLSSKVVPDLTGLAAAGSDAAAVLPPNRVAVAIPIDRLTSVGYAIRPGDRVDVITSMLFVDVDQQFQTLLPNVVRFLSVAPSEDNPNVVTISLGELRGQGEFDTLNIRSDSLGGSRFETVLIEPSEFQQRPRLTTQTTIQDALVIWVGTFPEDGNMFGATATPFATATPLPDEVGGTTDEVTIEETPEVAPRPDIVTLAVSPQEAVELTWFVEAGLPLTFALRSASSTSLQDTNAVTLNYIMNRFNIRVPERANYSLEPAIRSIRSIDVGNRIELYDASQQRSLQESEGEGEDENNENN